MNILPITALMLGLFACGGAIQAETAQAVKTTAPATVHAPAVKPATPAVMPKPPAAKPLPTIVKKYLATMPPV